VAQHLWTAAEYETQQILHRGGVSVPRPVPEVPVHGVPVGDIPVTAA